MELLFNFPFEKQTEIDLNVFLIKKHLVDWLKKSLMASETPINGNFLNFFLLFWILSLRASAKVPEIQTSDLPTEYLLIIVGANTYL